MKCSCCVHHQRTRVTLDRCLLFYVCLVCGKGTNRRSSSTLQPCVQRTTIHAGSPAAIGGRRARDRRRDTGSAAAVQVYTGDYIEAGLDRLCGVYLSYFIFWHLNMGRRKLTTDLLLVAALRLDISRSSSGLCIGHKTDGAFSCVGVHYPTGIKALCVLLWHFLEIRSSKLISIFCRWTIKVYSVSSSSWIRPIFNCWLTTPMWQTDYRLYLYCCAIYNWHRHN